MRRAHGGGSRPHSRRTARTAAARASGTAVRTRRRSARSRGGKPPVNQRLNAPSSSHTRHGRRHAFDAATTRTALGPQLGPAVHARHQHDRDERGTRSASATRSGSASANTRTREMVRSDLVPRRGCTARARGDDAVEPHQRPELERAARRWGRKAQRAPAHVVDAADHRVVVDASDHDPRLLVRRVAPPTRRFRAGSPGARGARDGVAHHGPRRPGTRCRRSTRRSRASRPAR